MRLKIKPVLYLSLCLLFLAAGLFITWHSARPEQLASIAKNIADNLEAEIRISDRDLDLVASLTDSLPEPFLFTYPVFHYENQKLIYWSDNTFVPSVTQVKDTFDIGLFTTSNETYILKKKVTGTQVFISVIKLLKRYPIRNDYLAPEYNDRILPSANLRIYEPNSLTGIEVCLVGKCLFRVEIPPDEITSHPALRKLAFFILLGSLVMYVLFVYSMLPILERKYREIGFCFLLLMFWLVRFVMTYDGFPGNLIKSQLFDPQIFASSSVNASLGDLFINLITLTALCFYVFRNYFRFAIFKFITHRLYSWLIGIFSSLCILFASLFPVVVIQTLYNNSTIALNISQSLKFDALRIIAIASVLISGICAFLFFHAFVRILVKIKNRFKVVSSFLIAVTIFILINEFSHQQYLSSLIISTLYFLFIYALDLYRSLKRLTFETFAYLFVAILFLSINGALAVQYFTHKEKIDNQFRFASNFLIDRDIFGEYLLHETSQKIARDVFTQTRIASPFLGKEAIRQKIRQVFLSNYFNKYDVDIFIFNSVGEPLDNNTSGLSEFINQHDKDSYQTGYEGIYFINNQEELDVTHKYLILIPIKRLSVTSGYVIIQLSLKKIIPESVYPELLVDFRIQQFYRTQDLNYAVFSNKQMVFSSGEFNYEKFFDTTLLGNPDLYTKGVSLADYDHIAVEDQNGRIAIVSTRQIPFIHKLANFSFFLVLGLLIILFMIFMQGVYQYFRGSRLFFSARIQLYLNLAFFIPLIIVSISTLSLTSRSSQQQLNDEYLNKSKIFSEQMVDYISPPGEAESSTVLENRLTDLAKLSDLDANIYYPNGELMATSQPLIFESNLLSTYVNAQAFGRITKGENLFIESEQVGSLNYFVSYAVLRSSQTGKLAGILGIPFFQSAYLLEKIQSVILINILNIFAFIFIVLLLLSYVVADRLTFPLRFITQSLRKTSLTNSNTPLTWPAEDEIGLMVKEYNSMLFKLSESKNELEQTQREKAWREIAQQVAHEIKNPLTPMKLTLQQLERSLQTGSNTQEKTSKAIAALLGQVDTLNEIASSFSGFVKMPAPVIQSLEIISTVKRTIDLHSPTGEITFRTTMKEAWVMGDIQLLSRTFSNIILNALQAGKPGQGIQVVITIELINSFCRIVFKDNGKGIEPQIADRVFIPHFSTKKTGSGLGLAIAKQAIEQMNGRIWFETQVDKGTAFYIELPLSA
jgi:two-component system nitrogen regulation sensor histidine kinase NtrY